MAITEITGYCVLAEVQYGSNGDDNSNYREYLIAGSNASATYGKRVWDSNTSDGVNSGNVDTSFVVPAGGGTSNPLMWSVAGGATDPLSFGPNTYTTISSLKIRAAVTGPGMRMRWSNVSLAFYKAGVLKQTKSVLSPPDANTLGLTVSDPVEKISTVTPTASDNDEVRVVGKVLIACDPGVYPASDIFGQIFAFNTGCTVVT